MFKLKPQGMESGAFQGAQEDYSGLITLANSSHPPSVDGIPENGMANGCQVDPDLVSSARAWNDLEEADAGSSGQDPVIGDGLAALRTHRDFLPVPWMAGQWLLDTARVIRHITPYGGKIDPADRVVPELIRKSVMSQVVLCRHHNTGSSLVEPVYDARPGYSPDTGQIPAVVEQGVDKGSRRMPVGGMDHNVRRLVDDNEVPVLVKDGQRDLLGLNSGGLRGGDFNDDHVPGAEKSARFGGKTVQENIPCFYKFLDA
jgi:hypothetical protein